MIMNYKENLKKALKEIGITDNERIEIEYKNIKNDIIDILKNNDNKNILNIRIERGELVYTIYGINYNDPFFIESITNTKNGMENSTCAVSFFITEKEIKYIDEYRERTVICEETNKDKISIKKPVENNLKEELLDD